MVTRGHTSLQRHWTIGALTGALLLSVASGALAQDGAAHDEIIVTGSRLKRPDASLYPLSTISGEAIERRGILNVLDAVRTDPATGLGATPAGTQNSQGVGSAFVDLFDLGTQRTLTLVDGRRVVTGNQSTLFGASATGLQVDLNTIPTGLIERIDIVSVGGAPSYGADAVAGTVNIVLKKNFEGAELDTQYGAYDGGFGDVWRVRGLVGHNFDEGRGNVTLTVEQSEVDGFTYARGNYLNRLPALAPNPLNGLPFATGPEPNGIVNNILIQDFRIPSVSTGGVLLRNGTLPTYLTPAGRAYLAANPEIAALHPEFALANGSPPFGLPNSLITRLATPAEIAAGARPPEFMPGAPARVAVPMLFRPDGTLAVMDVGTIAADQPLSALQGSGGDGLSLVPLSTLQTQLDRQLVMLRAHYEVAPWMRVFTNVHLARVEAVEPANQPAFNGTLFGGISGPLGFRTDNPFLTDQARAILTDPAYSLDPASRADVSWRAFGLVGPFGGCQIPGMPADIAAGCPSPAPGTRTFYTSRAYTDLVGTAPSRTDTDTANLVFGLDGAIPFLGEGWVYDSFVSYGRSKAVNRNVSIAQAQFNAARDAVAAGGAIVCRVNAANAAEREAARFGFRYTNQAPADGAAPLDPTSPAPRAGFYRRSVGDPLGASEAVLDACQPLNLFGEGNASEAARAYVVAPLVTSNVNEQTVFEFNVSGPLASLWAGDLEVAAGLSWRRESTSFRAENDVSRFGLARAVAYGDIVDRDFTSFEYYVEASLPLIGEAQDVPLVHGLSLNGSVRAIDHSLAGRDEAWTYGLTWSPTDWLTLRGNRTHSVRSPSLTELYLPPSGTFQGGVDPCDRLNIGRGSSPAIRLANCKAAAEALGFNGLDDFNSLIAFAPVQGQLDGNPTLRNEQADAFTLGATVQTDRLLGDLIVSVDYVDIEIEGAIEPLALTQILEACYDSAAYPNEFCGRFTRQSGSFNLDFGSAAAPAFRTRYENIGRRDFAGVTLSADWTLDLTEALGQAGAANLGVLNLRFSYAHIDHLEIDLTGTGEVIDRQDGEVGRPSNESQLTAAYQNGPLTLVWVWAHQGAAVFDRDALPENRAQLGVEAYDLFHGAIIVDLDERVEARVTVNNVFDTPPPFGSGSLAYDQVGRYWQLGLKVGF